MLSIKELRTKTGLSQSEFAKRFHLNKGTLANWEQDLRTPPEHVVYMIETILKQEECLANISSRIISEKQKDRSDFYSEEICQTMKNAFYLAIDIVEEEKSKTICTSDVFEERYKKMTAKPAYLKEDIAEAIDGLKKKYPDEMEKILCKENDKD